MSTAMHSIITNYSQSYKVYVMEYISLLEIIAKRHSDATAFYRPKLTSICRPYTFIYYSQS